MRTGAWLESRGITGDAAMNERRRASANVKTAAERAEAAPWPASSALYSDVQDVGAPS